MSKRKKLIYVLDNLCLLNLQDLSDEELKDLKIALDTKISEISWILRGRMYFRKRIHKENKTTN